MVHGLTRRIRAILGTRRVTSLPRHFHSPPASQSAPRGATPGAVVIGVVAMSTSILIATSISTTRISIAKIIRRIFRHAALTQAASGSMTRAIERVSPTEITRLPRSLTEGRTPKLLRRANHFAEGRRAVARIWLGAEPAGYAIAAVGSAAF